MYARIDEGGGGERSGGEKWDVLTFGSCRSLLCGAEKGGECC